MFIILDVLALTLCSFLALALRLDFHLEQNYINNIYKYLFTDSLILICIFSIFRLYKSMWTYASINETINIIISCSIYEIISFLYKQILEVNLPRSFYIIELFLLYIFIGAIRYSYRIARVIKDYYHEKSGLTNTMIIGAGEAGRMLITEIYNNKVNFNNKICCIIDDDKNKIGSYIKNIPVVGNREYIEKAVENYNIEEIIIAMPSIGRENLNIIIDECQKTNCTIKTLPGLNELVGKPTMKNFKLLVDVFPFRNKHWHVTTGFYWGPSTVAKAENAAYDATSLVSVAIYNNLYNRVKESWESQISDDPNVIPIPYISIGGNKIYADESLYNKFMDYGRMGVHVGDYPDGTPYRMEPEANNMVSCKIKVNNFRPYLGFGYGGKLSNRSDRNWISFDCGAMFWGGTPRIITHDGVDLAKDVKNISGKVGDYVSLFKAVKVYPVLELRLTHRIF